MKAKFNNHFLFTQKHHFSYRMNKRKNMQKNLNICKKKTKLKRGDFNQTLNDLNGPFYQNNFACKQYLCTQILSTFFISFCHFICILYLEKCFYTYTL